MRGWLGAVSYASFDSAVVKFSHHPQVAILRKFFPWGPLPPKQKKQKQKNILRTNVKPSWSI